MQTRQQKYNNPFKATMTGILDLFRKNVPDIQLDAGLRMDGKNVLVDGASSGLGFAVAEELARRGATVVMACRSGIPEKGEEIRKKTGAKDVFMEPVDFSGLSSVTSLIANLKKYGSFDVYVCNAGIVPRSSRMTVDGFEEMFMVNYFSKYLMIRLLLKEGLLKDPSRIVVVASESHRNARSIDWEKFGMYEEFTIGKSVERYGYYKLLLTTFAVELSRRLKKDGKKISVLTLCPGPINSNIAREAPGFFQPLLRLVFSLFFRSPARAAVPVVYFATSPDAGEKEFEYLFLMTRRDVDEKAADPENGTRIWEKSESIIKARQIDL